MPTEVETRSQRGRRRAVVTRRLVPPRLLLVAATSAVVSCWKKPSTLVCITSGVRIRVSNIAPHFWCFVILDHFDDDPVATPIHATGHQLVTLCRSVCAEERAQILEPIMSSKYCCRSIPLYY